MLFLSDDLFDHPRNATGNRDDDPANFSWIHCFSLNGKGGHQHEAHAHLLLF
jgi:hypothetical protein